MTVSGLSTPNWVSVAVLALVAVVAPLPLYVVALACFGLPHVLWELAWIRRTAGPRLSLSWWSCLAATLVVQAAGRSAAALGRLDGRPAVIIDLATLALALALVVTVPFPPGRRGRLARALALASGAALALATLSPTLTVALLILLSVVHNFTPIGLARMALPSPATSVVRIFLLPIAVLALPWSGTGLVLPASWQPAEAQWLNLHLPWLPPGLLSALVLAQCLHYYVILRVMPPFAGVPLLGGAWRIAAILVSLGLTAGFIFGDFPETRRFYGIAAGMHAWLEWPVLLCVLGGLTAAKPRTEEPAPGFEG